MRDEEVILVNELDQELGYMEKLKAHQEGLLHRAFSVFIFNSKGEALIQKRASTKYHSASLWSNTCCSHPRKGEKTKDAAHRRLQEEVGLVVQLDYSHQFIYHVEFENGLSEHELDHVFVGVSDQLPTLNPDEAEDFKYLNPRDCLASMEARPDDYTFWFKALFGQVVSKITEKQAFTS